MGKSDEKQTKERAHKATGESKQHKNKPSFDAASFDAATFEATDDEGLRHSQWRDQFRQLCEYKVQFGHCLVPNKYAANLKLGHWVSTQRNKYRLHQEGKPTPFMTAEQIRALDAIGFNWETARTSGWNVRFQQLCEYKIQSGNCLVPQHYTTNPKLGRWVSTQRAQYKLYQEEKPTSMTAVQIRALDVIGFDWGTTYTTDWSVRFQQLCEFKEEFGHCIVPIRYSANPKLGNWVSAQRKRYKGKPTPMTVEHIRALESIGFEWDPSADSWNEQFEQLRKFVVQFGHSVVPLRYSAIPKLGQWVFTQRGNYRLYLRGKSNPMTAERIQKLETVDFKW